MQGFVGRAAAGYLIAIAFGGAGLLPAVAVSGNCLVQGNRKIGDCKNVHVGPSKPITLTKDAQISGNYGAVVVRRKVTASISGNTDDIRVEPDAKLFFSGNASNIIVFGRAEIDGNAGWVTVYRGGHAIIRGIVNGASGDGRITKVRGAIVGGQYIR